MRRSAIALPLLFPAVGVLSAGEPEPRVVLGNAYLDTVRVERVAQLLNSTSAALGGFDSRLPRLEEEFNGITEPLLQYRLVQRIRVSYPLPAVLERPGGPPGPADPGFAGALAWGMRRSLLAKLKGSRPNEAWIWEESGHVSCALRRFDDCLEDLDRAVSLGTKEPETYALYALAAQSLEDYPLAFQAASLAMRLDPSNKMARGVARTSKGLAANAELPSVLRKPGGMPLLSNLDTYVSLRFKDAPLAAFLEKISAAAKVRFILPEAPPKRKINAGAAGMSAQTFLGIVLPTLGLKHQRVGLTETYVILPEGPDVPDPVRGIKDPLLEKRLRFAARKMPLDKFLARITKEAGLRFKLTPGSGKSRVTLDMKGASVRDALSALSLAKDLSIRRDEWTGIYEVTAGR